MSVRLSRLPSGLTVVTHAMDHLESTALGIWVGAGARSEQDNEHGLSHVLEHMAFKGTKTRSAIDIAEEIEAVGGEVNAATSVETTSYYARILKDCAACAGLWISNHQPRVVERGVRSVLDRSSRIQRRCVAHPHVAIEHGEAKP